MSRSRRSTSEDRELRLLVPRRLAADSEPERACVVMAQELRALGHDIAAARAHARRVAAGGLDLRRVARASR